ncbi:MAG: hypothetical protein ACE5JI_16485 [Acidobacteriota bacterium]
MNGAMPMAPNPLTFTEKVAGDFLKYQLSAFPFSGERLHAQMRDLLSVEAMRVFHSQRNFQRPLKIARTVKQVGSLHPHRRSTWTRIEELEHLALIATMLQK